MKRLMQGEMEKISSEHICAVDVRDVAFAHLAAVKQEAAANKRFLLVQGSNSFHDFAKPVVDKYSALGWPVTTTYAESDPNETISLFNNSASRDILGVQYHEFAQTMLDMADKMVALGTVSKDAAPAL